MAPQTSSILEADCFFVDLSSGICQNPEHWSHFIFLL